MLLSSCSCSVQSIMLMFPNCWEQEFLNDVYIYKSALAIRSLRQQGV